MECAEITDRLWEYLDGELAAEEAAASVADARERSERRVSMKSECGPLKE